MMTEKCSVTIIIISRKNSGSLLCCTGGYFQSTRGRCLVLRDIQPTCFQASEKIFYFWSERLPADVCSELCPRPSISSSNGWPLGVPLTWLTNTKEDDRHAPPPVLLLIGSGGRVLGAASDQKQGRGGSLSTSVAGTTNVF